MRKRAVPHSAQTARLEGDWPEMRWVLLPTILASSMAFIDGTALNVALPALQADLGASGKQLLWVVNAYLLFLSALILLGGSLGDRYGRKRAFMFGIGLFATASFLCGVAPSSELLIAARGVQGIGGALLVPGSLAVLTACVPESKRGRAIGTWSMFTTVTTIIGPVLGGVLASAGLWRGVFFINVPLAGVALLFLVWKVPETTDEETRSLDLVGAAFVTLGLAGVTYGAIEAPERGLTHPVIVASVGLGVISTLAFVLAETKVRSPMVPLHLFRDRTFAGSNLITLLVYAGLSAAFFFFSLALIQAQGYSARAAGFAQLPFAASLALLARWAGDMADRIGPRRLLIFGPLITGIGFLLLGLPGLGSGPSAYWTHYMPGVLLSGVGMGLTVAPLTTAVMTSVPDRNVGVASGVNNAIARSAGVLAIAFIGGLGLLTFQADLAGRADQLQLSPNQHRALMMEANDLGEADPPSSLGSERRRDVERAIRASLVTTFRWAAFICAALAGLGSLVAVIWIAPGPRHAGQEHNKR